MDENNPNTESGHLCPACLGCNDRDCSGFCGTNACTCYPEDDNYLRVRKVGDNLFVSFQVKPADVDDVNRILARYGELSLEDIASRISGDGCDIHMVRQNRA